MNFEDLTHELKDATDSIINDGIDELTELKHARKLAIAAQKFIDALEEAEDTIDETELAANEEEVDADDDND